MGYDNMLMVPATVKGKLTEQISKVIRNSDAPGGYRTLLLEDGGTSVQRDLVKSNPFQEKSCSRKGCLVCRNSEGRGSCWASNQVYEITCNRAPCSVDDGAPKPKYVGETSRTPYTRGKGHLALYKSKNEGSLMWRHTGSCHGGVVGREGGVKDYKMEPKERFREPLTRIMNEAVRIEMQEKDPKVISLNSKREYFGAQFISPVFEKGVREW